ncbi:ABC transporter permease [Streptomyces sp. NPDC051207]|uniref:ABC transporter permease n=1 Tax=Streptomyces sp. NPDC051207 TaxID=3154641 RepID=UPI003444C163
MSSTTQVPAASGTLPVPRHPVLNNRASYLSFGLAWLVGHGASALAYGDDPLVGMPSAVPNLLLTVGLLGAVAVTSAVTAKAQRGVRGRQAVIGNLLAGSWVIGFGALFLIITALSEALDKHEVHTLMWPTASGLVVGLLYLASGAVYRDALQYTLGSWLALASSAALFLDGANLYWALALAGGGAYLVAASREARRYQAALRQA